jgi:hypothetical protein
MKIHFYCSLDLLNGVQNIWVRLLLASSTYTTQNYTEKSTSPCFTPMGIYKNKATMITENMTVNVISIDICMIKLKKNFRQNTQAQLLWNTL